MYENGLAASLKNGSRDVLLICQLDTRFYYGVGPTRERCYAYSCIINLEGNLVAYDVPFELWDLRKTLISGEASLFKEQRTSPPPLACSFNTKYGNEVLTASKVSCDR